MISTDNQLKFDEQGLLPAVIQDWLDGTVLMLGYMNQDALGKTLTTQSVHFWSRSRQRLWEKGETSGHKLHGKRSLPRLRPRYDTCEGSSPLGPTCHTGERACFFSKFDGLNTTTEKSSDACGGILEGVLRTIGDRRAPSAPRFVYDEAVRRGSR